MQSIMTWSINASTCRMDCW